MSKTYLVTGANSGLGLDSVRRLALMPTVKYVFLGCRSKTKAETAIASLPASIDRNKLKYFEFDAAAKQQDIDQQVQNLGATTFFDGIILNAGGIGDNASKKPSGPNNVLNCYQINLVGHIHLVESLKIRGKMAEGCGVVYSGSEAARGVPIMMIGNPKIGDTSEWFENKLTGKSKGSDPMSVYALAKGFAALFFAEWARQNPKYSVWVVSPGATAGTNALAAEAVPAHFRVLLPVMIPIMKAIGVFHSLEAGSDRYVTVLTKEHNFKSGTFLASKRGTTGVLADQSTLRGGKKYGDHIKQKAAFKALSRYILPIEAKLSENGASSEIAV